MTFPKAVPRPVRRSVLHLNMVDNSDLFLRPHLRPFLRACGRHDYFLFPFAPL
jgi:hypothetical protein